MRALRPNLTMVAGIAGLVLGGLVEAVVNRLSGRPAVSNGMLWGAVLAVLAASVPDFVRMGALSVKSDKPLVNLAAGAVLFVLISAAVVVIFYAIFALLGWLVT